MPRNYNFIYNKLVLGGDDLVGLIAYSIYKQHKIEFINKYVEEAGKDPEEDDLRSFHLSSATDTQLELYRSQAEIILSDIVISGAEEKIQESADQFKIELDEKFEETRAEMDNDLTDRIKKAMPPYWVGLTQGFFASLFFAIIVSLIMFIGRNSEQGVQEIIRQTINNMISTSDSTKVQINN